jgi:hypothetical protein
MNKLIESNLNVLIGKPLTNLGRASNLFWFNFGDFVFKKNRLGIERKVGQFSLHVQCSWRISSNNKIIIAYRDVYTPSSQWNEEEEFNWEIVGNNRFDEQAGEINKDSKSSFIVKQISADNLGGVKIHFDNHHVLEVFPDGSNNEDELWRFITNIGDSYHMVVTGKSIEI